MSPEPLSAAKPADAPDWLAQPKWVADARQAAPHLDLKKPERGSLTLHGAARGTPFAALDLEGPAAKAFAVEPTPKGKLWDDRAEGAEVNLVSVSFSVCDSVAHTLHVHAQNGTSSHVVIDREGTLHQLVDLGQKSFAAGPHNNRLVSLVLVDSVDRRVPAASFFSPGETPAKISERMPRRGEDAFAYSRVNDAQKRAAVSAIQWIAQQPEFRISAAAADPHWVADAEEDIAEGVCTLSGAVGLYQLRRQHVAPGFDAMEGIAEGLAEATRKLAS